SIVIPAAVLATSPSLSQQTSNFYQNKTVTLVSPTGAGGSFSIAAQLLAAHMRNHIPGKPNIIVEHRPGASGAISANYLYNVAPQDGTVLGMPLTSFILTQYLQNKSVRYDSSKFKYIGRVTDNHRVLAVSSKSKAQTLDDLKRFEVAIGASGKYSTTNLQPALANALLKTRFRTVLGYSGG